MQDLQSAYITYANMRSRINVDDMQLNYFPAFCAMLLIWLVREIQFTSVATFCKKRVCINTGMFWDENGMASQLGLMLQGGLWCVLLLTVFLGVGGRGGVGGGGDAVCSLLTVSVIHVRWATYSILQSKEKKTTLICKMNYLKFSPILFTSLKRQNREDNCS